MRTAARRRAPVGVTLALPPHTDDPFAGYRAGPGAFDEAVAPDGSLRPEAGPAVAALAGHGLRAARALVHEEVRARGVVYRTATGAVPFDVDPVPRALAAGSGTRSRAGWPSGSARSTRSCADVYGDARIVAEGVVPARVLDSAEYYEPRPRSGVPPGGAGSGSPGSTSCATTTARRRARGQPAHAERHRLRVAARRGADAPASTPPGERAARLDAGPQCCAAGAARGRPGADAATRASCCSPTGRATPPTGSTAARGALGVPLVEPAELSAAATAAPARRRSARSTSSTGARTRTALRLGGYRVASCCSRRWRAGRSASSTRSAPASPTTSSSTPTSRTWSASTSARSRCCRRCATSTSATPRRLERGARPLRRARGQAARAATAAIGVVICPHADAPTRTRRAGGGRATPERLRGAAARRCSPRTRP